MLVRMREALGLVAVSAVLAGMAGGADAPRILERAPEPPDATARYLFYLHGRIIETQGPEAVSPVFGRYEYHRILRAFADHGFTVVAEVRKDGAGTAFVEATARQVRGLLEAGVPGDHVTVVGFSKGGFLALGVCASVASDEVRYAILAGCSADPDRAARLGPRLRGRFLSLLDDSDRFSPSCETLFGHAGRVREKSEQVFETGLDHGLFYRPREDWTEALFSWVSSSPPARSAPTFDQGVDHR